MKPWTCHRSPHSSRSNHAKHRFRFLHRRVAHLRQSLLLILLLPLVPTNLQPNFDIHRIVCLKRAIVPGILLLVLDLLAVDGFVASKTYVTKAVIHYEIEGAWFGKVCGHCLYPSWFPCWFPTEDCFGEALLERSAVFGLIDEMSACAGAASAVKIFDYAHDSGIAGEVMLWLSLEFRGRVLVWS